MNKRFPRAGSVARAVLVIAFVLMAVPLVLFGIAFVGWRVSTARAEEMRVQALVAQSEAIRSTEDAARRVAFDTPHVQADTLPVTPDQVNQFEAVPERGYRWQTTTVAVPTLDPETGRTATLQRLQYRQVPVNSSRHVQAYVATGHDPSVTRLVGELRELDEEDENYERKLGELRNRLELEFANMREAQAKEINATEERLDVLKKRHQQRGENQAKIVQRRIDELLGRSDDLQWDVGSSSTPRPVYGSRSLVPKRPSSRTSTPQTLPPPQARRNAQEQGNQWGFPGRQQIGQPLAAKPADPTYAQPPRPAVAPVPPGVQAPFPSPVAVPPAKPRTPSIKNSGSLRPPRATSDPFGQRRRPTTNDNGSDRSAPDDPFAPNPFGADPFTPKPAQQDPFGAQTQSLRTSKDSNRANNQPRTEPRQINPGWTSGSFSVNDSATGRLFQFLRKLAASQAELHGSEIEIKRLQKLTGSAALRAGTLQQAQLRLEQLQREVKLNEFELKAMKESLARRLQAAEERIELSVRAKNIATQRFEQGSGDVDSVIKVEQQVNDAKVALDDAKANLNLFTRALALLEQSEATQRQATTRNDRDEVSDTTDFGDLDSQVDIDVDTRIEETSSVDNALQEFDEAVEEDIEFLKDDSVADRTDEDIDVETEESESVPESTVEPGTEN